MISHKPFVFRFQEFELSERELRLVRSGRELAVEPKALRVLLYLVKHPGRLISKEELLDAVWRQAAVSENSLTRAVTLLRKALDEDAREPRYIATVPTAGYRFICHVECLDDPSPSLSIAEQPPSSKSVAIVPDPTVSIEPSTLPQPISTSWQAIGRTAARIALVASLFGAVSAGVWVLKPLPALRIANYNQITHDGQQKVLAGTDGARIYVTRPDPREIAQVSVAGGWLRPIPINLPFPWLEDVESDGSNLLVHSSGDIWSMSALGDLSRHIGTAAEAAYSPDGKLIAYWKSDGELSLMKSDGTEPYPITNFRASGNALPVADITWSPDGRSIRFTRDHGLWEISSNGSNLHQILLNWHPSEWKCCGRWMPDGQIFVFLSGDTLLSSAPLLPGAQLWAMDERHKLWHRRNSEPTQLTVGPTRWGGPIPSRDGKSLFALGVTVRGELTRFDSHSHQLQPYLGGISAEFLAFSNDRKRVAYVSFPNGALWRSNTDGTGLMQLTEPPFYPKSVRWSPDGASLLFNDLAPNGKNALYTVSSLKGGPLHRLLPNDDEAQSEGTWSPDGKKIAFSTCVCAWNETSGKNEIKILDLSSGVATVIPGSDGLWSPRWSPDGRSILARPVNDESAIRVYDFESHKWIAIRPTNSTGRVNWPEWSHDSRFVYFHQADESPGVYRIAREGGSAERVVDLPTFYYTGWYSMWMGLDAEDAPLLLRDAGSSDIYALKLNLE